ncbi:hypothetical protein HK096_009019 [Nowakowskiella sp. JEL0078]|nr:hypothetical protein HK096_009019 [Nowakowskiella sp. JEL0078]
MNNSSVKSLVIESFDQSIETENIPESEAITKSVQIDTNTTESDQINNIGESETQNWKDVLFSAVPFALGYSSIKSSSNEVKNQSIDVDSSEAKEKYLPVNLDTSENLEDSKEVIENVAIVSAVFDSSAPENSDYKEIVENNNVDTFDSSSVVAIEDSARIEPVELKTSDIIASIPVENSKVVVESSNASVPDSPDAINNTDHNDQKAVTRSSGNWLNALLAPLGYTAKSNSSEDKDKSLKVVTNTEIEPSGQVLLDSDEVTGALFSSISPIEAVEDHFNLDLIPSEFEINESTSLNVKTGRPKTPEKGKQTDDFMTSPKDSVVPYNLRKVSEPEEIIIATTQILDKSRKKSKHSIVYELDLVVDKDVDLEIEISGPVDFVEVSEENSPSKSRHPSGTLKITGPIDKGSIQEGDSSRGEIEFSLSSGSPVDRSVLLEIDNSGQLKMSQEVDELLAESRLIEVNDLSKPIEHDILSELENYKKSVELEQPTSNDNSSSDKIEATPDNMDLKTEPKVLNSERSNSGHETLNQETTEKMYNENLDDVIKTPEIQIINNVEISCVEEPISQVSEEKSPEENLINSEIPSVNEYTNEEFTHFFT